MNNEISNGDVVVGDETVGTEIAAEAAYEGAEVTTMTTETTIPAVETKPAKAPRAPKAPKIKTPYPFESKGSILARVAASDSFMLQCLCQLHSWQTEHEQATKSTVVRNRRGFMSSHAVNGSKLAEKALSGETLTSEEMDKARSITVRYGKQLAAGCREAAIAASPELARTAAIFGV